jgi:hypothetical protein
MAGLKVTYEQNVLNKVFRNTDFTSPATLYVGLYTTAPTDSTEGTEVSGGAYARQTITFGAPTGGAPSQIVNSAQVLFPEATANWGTIVAVALHSSATGTGNQVLWANVTTSKAINSGDQAAINASAFTITMD